MLKCSFCGKEFERNLGGDAQKHLSNHSGIYCKLIKENNNLGASIKYS